MGLLNDIYHTMNIRLLERNFDEFDIENKKIIIDEELKMFLISKLKTLTDISKKGYFNFEKYTLTDLVAALADLIPEEEKSTTLNHLIHFILNIASSFQGYTIVWWEEDDETLIENPIIEFRENRWEHLKTHKDTKYTQTFNLVYDTFLNRFLPEAQNDNFQLNKKMPEEN